MPEYEQPDLAHADALDHQADVTFTQGQKAGQHDDQHVRVTLLLLVFALVLILGEPLPPS
jgi:hypothetical protein